MKQDNKVLSHTIANFLLNYRNTPHMAVWDLNSKLDVFGMQTFLRGLIYVR
jgi:hypothetical protein